jgi:hypothetical protein
MTFDVERLAADYRALRRPDVASRRRIAAAVFAVPLPVVVSPDRGWVRQVVGLCIGVAAGAIPRYRTA